MLCLCGFKLYSRWVPLKDASSYVISVKNRLEPILIEGIHIQGR